MITLSKGEEKLFVKIYEMAAGDLDIIIDNMNFKDGKPYSPQIGRNFIRATIDYSGSRIAAIGADRARIRHFGILSLQVFTQLYTGTIENTALCDRIYDLLQGYQSEGLEVFLVHAPKRMNDDRFFGKIMRAEFKLN